MLEIKFTHTYKKLLGTNGQPIKEAVLLLASAIDKENMPEVFIQYDTDSGKFPIPDGRNLVLLFVKIETPKPAARNLFTTVRRFTEEKAKFYQENQGKTFKITITT